MRGPAKPVCRCVSLDLSSLIPVLVTGIQPPRVGAVNDAHRRSRSPAPKDLGALDSCDEHRNEGDWGDALT
ncbi:hypothetical protein ELI48_04670 [Rhizobium ruizarguesonis]|nr:hypothetical protein ELI48_04670 [Rhizobium ruizarguesonis]TAW08782.1 hypothetical protein ELI26_03800 [Rhizobium ruizarguesonis]TAW15048.1 hypothetical protein ELI25_03870 [Rhizobium ruizarguesonis]TAW97247.1 hypothetical protein ELI12_03885 [Rhizobium ruizarguesonis]TAZ50376.1 hypothetical protein ELH76_03870 [Rhizobium ruizarguesonis]